MPRRNRRRTTGRGAHQPRETPRDGASYFGTRRESAPTRTTGAVGAYGWAETFLMRRVGASAAVKYYVCPGCRQNIPPGVAHVVAWPDTVGGGDDRRHWHTGCWQRR